MKTIAKFSALVLVMSVSSSVNATGYYEKAPFALVSAGCIKLFQDLWYEGTKNYPGMEKLSREEFEMGTNVYAQPYKNDVILLRAKLDAIPSFNETRYCAQIKNSNYVYIAETYEAVLEAFE